MKHTVTRSVLFVALAAVVSFAPRTAEATPLLPGATGAIPSFAGVFNPGTLLDSLTSPYVTSTRSINGTVRAAVYRNANGFLDFYYQVTNDPAPYTGANAISGASGSRFGGFAVDVQYRTDGFGIFTAQSNPPITTARSADGSEITFWFGPPWTGANKIMPGESSSVLLIRTNAYFYVKTGTVSVQNGGMAYINVFEPTAVPEVSSMSLLLVGLAGLYGTRRRLA